MLGLEAQPRLQDFLLQGFQLPVFSQRLKDLQQFTTTYPAQLSGGFVK